jgi:hypothetical protein
LELLFSPDYQITLINCEIVKGSLPGVSPQRLKPHVTREARGDTVVAKLSRFDADLQPGIYQLKENAVMRICKIKLPEWAISDETLIFLEPIELEIVSFEKITI